ncbi:MAG: RNA methyltransferase [Candidatus Falkowbacteria bacterium]
MTISDYQAITSAQNKQIKTLEKLNSKKYREELQQFTVENLVIILDALKSEHDFEALFVTEEFYSKHLEQVNYLQNNSNCKDFFLINPRINKIYSNLDTPSGITAVYNIKEKTLDKSSVVYLNAVSDPGNMGTIMRSALAFGFVNFVLDENCVDIYNSKVISAAKDAIFKLNIIEDKSGAWLKANKLPLYITSSHNGLDLAKFKPASAFCLVLGNESHGVDLRIMAIASKALKIKMSSEIESLNVATAAAILFYELGKK